MNNFRVEGKKITHFGRSELTTLENPYLNNTRMTFNKQMAGGNV